VYSIFLDNIHLVAQLRLLWHLELHKTLALKHLQRLAWHFFGPLQLHLTHPCPPEVDWAMTADLNETDLSLPPVFQEMTLISIYMI
jgi:hypothetical protein